MHGSGSDTESTTPSRNYTDRIPWLCALAPEHRLRDWDPEKTRRAEGLMEEMTAFRRNTERAIERYRQEGIELGIERGIETGIERGLARGFEHERSLLARQASRRFGDAAGRRLGAWLAGVSDPAVFDEVGDLIVDCATGEELLYGVDGTQTGDL